MKLLRFLVKGYETKDYGYAQEREKHQDQIRKKNSNAPLTFNL